MENSELIKTLNACADACNRCADACLDEEDVEKLATCIRTDRVCAELCSSTAKILSVQFGPVDDLLKFCERVCGICADECENHSHDHCQECAKACRECQEACLSSASS